LNEQNEVVPEAAGEGADQENLLYEGDDHGDGDSCDQFSVFGTYRPVDQLLNINGDDCMWNGFLTAHPPSAWSSKDIFDTASIHADKLLNSNDVQSLREFCRSAHI
jgi:hypothetical protein